MTDEANQVTDPFDLTGRIALITGGGRGLGRQMTEAFASHGADVVIASRKLDVLETAAAEIGDATGRQVTPIQCHVGHWEQTTALVDEVYERFGRIDILVNNAGMSPVYERLSEVSEALWDKVFDVNLKGPFRLATLVAERMKSAGRGSIINLSSTASVKPGAAEIPYGAAKAGINNLSVGLAKTFGPEVRVNTLMPGPFRTDISDAWDWEMIEREMKRLPMRRVGEPNEIVGAALLLASDAGSYITGSTIKVDGGMSEVVGGG